MAIPLGDTTTVPKSYSDLTGTIPASAAPTNLQASPPLGDNSTAIATTAWVKGQGYSGGGGVGAVNSVFTRVGDIIAQTGDYTVSQITGAAPLVSPIFSGTPTAPTPSLLDNSTKIATTAFVLGQAYAPLVSPSFTGTPTAPTQSLADNSTNLATTAWVVGQNFTTGSPRQLNVTSAGGVSPTPVISGECPSTVNPSIFFQDTNANWHPLMGIDETTTNTINPIGTPVWMQRMFFRDTLDPDQVGKNAFISVNHLAGTTASAATNQDRAIWVNISNVSATISSFAIDESNVVTLTLTNLKQPYGKKFGFAKNQIVVCTGLSVGTYLNNVQFTVLTATTGSNSAQTITMSSGSFTHASVITTADTGQLDIAVYGMEAIQMEMEIFGTPVTQNAVDSEYSVLSVQMSDSHTGTAIGASIGANCIRAQYFRNQNGQWTSVHPAVIRALMYNNVAGDGGGETLTGILVQVGQQAAGTNLSGISVWVKSPLTGRLSSNVGLLLEDFGTNIADRNIRSAGSMATSSGVNEFQGPVLLGTRTPASATDTGITGTVTWDANFIYICTATNQWKRAAISTW